MQDDHAGSGTAYAPISSSVGAAAADEFFNGDHGLISVWDFDYDMIIESDTAITQDETWSGIVHLNAQVFVKQGATLTIEAGTDVVCYFTPGDKQVGNTHEPSAPNEAHAATATHAAVIVIERGAKIMAEGTKDQPITLHSQEVSSTDPADWQAGTWGGLIVMGKAPVNGCDSDTVDENGVSHIEGIDNELADNSYGGDNPNDNSGVITYMRVWFGGAELSKDNEINGITLAGVGKGTTIHHIEVAYNLDDGLELFGGTVDLQYVSLLYNRDDQLDIDCGYQGSIQYLFVAEAMELGDHAYEIDGHNDCDSSGCPESVTLMTKPTISQATVLGPSSQSGSCQYKDDTLIKLSDGAGGIYVNHILTFSPKAGALKDNDLTPTSGDLSAAGDLHFHYYYYHIGNADLEGGTEIQQWDDHCMPEPCTDATDLTHTDVKFNPGLKDLGDLTYQTVSGLDSAEYPGAFAPASNTWLMGWSLLSSYNKLEEINACAAPKVGSTETSFASSASISMVALALMLMF